MHAEILPEAIKIKKQTKNQANLHQLTNQQNRLINAPPLRQAQAQAADPALVQILFLM